MLSAMHPKALDAQLHQLGSLEDDVADVPSVVIPLEKSVMCCWVGPRWNRHIYLLCFTNFQKSYTVINDTRYALCSFIQPQKKPVLKKSHLFYMPSPSQPLSASCNFDIKDMLIIQLIWLVDCHIKNASLVIGCRNLKDTEWISKQDPYVVLEYGSNRYRTKTDTDGGRNPTFNERYVFPLIEGLHEINVMVYNSNTLTQDDFIGSGKVLLASVLSEGYHDSAWPLTRRSGKRSGEVRIIMHYKKPEKKVPSAGPEHSASYVNLACPPATPPLTYGGYAPATTYPSMPPQPYPPQPYPPQPYPPQAYQQPYPPVAYPPVAYPPQTSHPQPYLPPPQGYYPYSPY